MEEKGVIRCSKCSRDIKWVKMPQILKYPGAISTVIYHDDERLVDQNGMVRCFKCDTPNFLD